MNSLTDKAKRLIELGEKATPGPWESDPDCDLILPEQLEYDHGCGFEIPKTLGALHFDSENKNGRFIAEARNSAVEIAKAYLEILPEAENLAYEACAGDVYKKQNQKLREALLEIMQNCSRCHAACYEALKETE